MSDFGNGNCISMQLINEIKLMTENASQCEGVHIFDGIKHLHELKHKVFDNVEPENDQSTSAMKIYRPHTAQLPFDGSAPAKVKTKTRAENFATSWSKVSTALKYKIINDFIVKIESDRKKQKDLRYLLTMAIDNQQINKNADVEFDIEKKELIKIHKLQLCTDESNGVWKLTM